MIEGEGGGQNTNLLERWGETFYKNRGETNKDWKRKSGEGKKRGVGKNIST